MLAPNFLSATDLGIPEEQHDALIKTLGDFEQGRVQAFNMGSWANCIAGHCDMNYGTKFKMRGGDASFFLSPSPLDRLFGSQRPLDLLERTTLGEATQALRDYLTIGDPQW